MVAEVSPTAVGLIFENHNMSKLSVRTRFCWQKIKEKRQLR